MQTLRNYVIDAWQEPDRDLAPLVDPATEEPIARAGTAGVDFAAVLDHARGTGSAALRSLTYGERGELLKTMSKALREHRDELLDLSRLNTGTTRADGAFDVDGATGAFAYYASLARGLGGARALPDGDGTQLGKTEAFYGRHALVPKAGVAVLVNAFNFPAWGFAEKAAQALLAGMPVVVKPATSTALVAARCVEIVIAAGLLPEGALQLLCGATGDLLDRLGPQDVLAFTGSADTALALRGKAALLGTSVAVNVEADSLNAAVLGPDLVPGGATWELALRDVVREITQKSGQKCTAIRRVLVPRPLLPAVREALLAALARVVTGNAVDPAVTMGPLATAAQLAAAAAGIEELARETRRLAGGTRLDGVSAPTGKGFFFAPTLLEAEDAAAAPSVHRREVFAPVATLVPYDGSAAAAAGIVALGDGTLVTSAYADDGAWLAELFSGVAPWTGRLYVGSTESAGEAFGSGAALPQLLHGGPGRAGGGAELAGFAGLRLYSQRVALQGARARIDPLVGLAG